MKGSHFPAGVLIVATIGLAGLASGISLLDDDWGHLLLASRGVGFIVSTGWEGLAGQGGYYRPAVELSLYINYLVAGFAPAVYHVTNVVIHAGCSVLVWALARRFGLSDTAAWGGALLFFVLPIHTDTVFWIVGRTDSVCALFYMSALILFCDYLDRPHRRALVGFGICMALALLSKEMALALPGVLGVLALHRRALKQRHTWWALDVAIAVYFLYFLVRIWVLGGLLDGTPGEHPSVSARAMDIVKAAAKMGMTDAKWFGGVVLLTTGVAWATHRQSHMRTLMALTGLALVSLVPALGHLHNWYLYIPSAFFCIALARVWLQSNRRIFTACFVALWSYYAVVLAREGIFWREASQISETAIAKIMPHAQATTGRLFVLNVPAAWTPGGSFSGKPLLAYALNNAIAMRAPGALACEPVMVNHVWLMGEKDISCRITAHGDGQFDLSIERGGFFWFHGIPTGEPFMAHNAWGYVQAFSADSISVSMALEPGDRVVIFQEGSVRPWVP